MKHILKCPSCGSYGLSEDCKCGSKRLEPRPQKYSPEDKYAHYRRQAKEMSGEYDAKDEKEPNEEKRAEQGLYDEQETE